jgi:hypothetical protein
MTGTGVTGTHLQLLLTWNQMWNVLQTCELDLGDGSLVDQNEAMEYANQAVRECQALVHTIYEDYFLTKATTNLAMVSGQDTIALPTNIYANKIRGIIFTNGALIYEVKRIKEWHKFIRYRLERYTPNNAVPYKYFLVNANIGTIASIVLTPPSYDTGNYLETWYLRRANEFTTGSDICDIPEFVQFIYDHVRTKVYEKDGHPMLEKAMADKAVTRELMVDTLREMVPDHNNEIEADTSVYWEHS